MKHISKCTHCNKYTMNKICECGNATTIARPVKFSPEDRFGAYRRKAKLAEYKNRDLL